MDGLNVSLTDRAWAWLMRNVALPLGDRLYGQRMMARLRFLRRAQWWDSAQIAAYRDQQLRVLVQTAYTEVPLYRELMNGAGIRPEAIRSAADLRCLPILSKDTLRANYPERTTRPTGQRTYETFSSGSTGAPFAVREDAYTVGWYRAAFLLSLEWLGWRIGLPHVQTGVTTGRGRGRRMKDLMLRCHYVSAYDLSDAYLDSVLEYMARHGTRFLWGYPGGLYTLALRAQQRGWNQPLRAVGTWGDMLFSHYRQTIEQVFGARVYDNYGCGEGIYTAAQCEHGHYHIFETDVIVEYVDDLGQPVPPGTPGHLILTRLHPGPMPFIRYRVGDLGTSGAVQPCPCGRGFATIDHIAGRDTDIVITPSGNRLIVHFFTGVLEFFTQIDTFQVVQHAPDAITLSLTLRRDVAVGPDLIGRIVRALQDKGADLRIEVRIVDEIPLTPGGKRRFVIRQIGQPER